MLAVGAILAAGLLITARKREMRPDIVLIVDRRGVEFGGECGGFVPWTAINRVRLRNMYKFGGVLYVSITDPDLYHRLSGPYDKAVDLAMGKPEVRLLLDELDATPRDIIAAIRRANPSMPLDPGSYRD